MFFNRDVPRFKKTHIDENSKYHIQSFKWLLSAKGTHSIQKKILAVILNKMIWNKQKGTKIEKKILTYISSSKAVWGRKRRVHVHICSLGHGVTCTSYSREVVFNEGQLCSRGHWQCLETLFIVTMGKDAIDIWLVQVRETKHPTLAGHSNTTKNNPATNVISANAEKPCYRSQSRASRPVTNPIVHSSWWSLL